MAEEEHKPLMKAEDKAIMIAYVLSRAAMENLKIAMHEFRLSKEPMKRRLYHVKNKEYIRTHQQFHVMFKGFTAHLNAKELTELEESVNNMIAALW